ncbi:mitochondrial DNA-directed RNA polymerase [Acrasis kona]|uniref:DNA-directed RNA polymerase n=1 Tax=Acrasis kona TaxID=1008807 RepID=A0AAW2ZPG7_9EUKA
MLHVNAVKHVSRTLSKLSKKSNFLTYSVQNQTQDDIFADLLASLGANEPSILSKQIQNEREPAFQFFHEINDKQIKSEEATLETAKKRYHKEIDLTVKRDSGSQTPAAKKILIDWVAPLQTRIRDLQIRVAKGSLTHIDQELTTMVSSEKMAVITLYESFSALLSANGTIALSRLAARIGSVLTAEINVSQMTVPSHLKGRDNKFIRNINRYAKSAPEVSVLVDDKEILKISVELIKLLIEVAVIPGESDGEIIEVPAFTHSVVKQPTLQDETDTDHNSSIKSLGIVRMAPKLHALIADENTIREFSRTKFLPMVVKPKPWEEHDVGGYLTLKSSIMRVYSSDIQKKLLRDFDLKMIFESMNVLGETEWNVNKKVLDVVNQVWNNGGGVASIPSRTDHEVPPKPNKDVDKNIRNKQLGLIKRLKTENANMHSLRCDLLNKLKVAENFADEKFYFPHNLDFRGRAYPIPPHLNHMGADLNRGLLWFHESQPVGERGIFWLKIHLANLCGQDKVGLEERVDYVDRNIDLIKDSADQPLNGSQWWIKSENPWQTLAACFELTSILRSPDPHLYKSKLPVQMDGSCNGLQHYAALGRDNMGALHVNLLPTVKPMDVYSGVLNVVKKFIEKDSKEGNPIAALLNGKVYRATIKQTVMTSVYGVTWLGAKEQIRRRLIEKKEIDLDQVNKCSSYLATTTLKSLGEVFSSAKTIMEWLNECAHLISSVGRPVMWVSPLGLPIAQPYRRDNKQQIKTVLQSVIVVDKSDKLPINSARQKSAFPPNYVHSLDATHMMMTALKCHKSGICFASVHDSYWTHPNQVDLMNEHIRESFIELHSQPLLEALLEGFREMYPQVEFPDVPSKGSLDLERVKSAKYFFD